MQLDGTQFIYARVQGEYDPDSSMPIVSVRHEDDEFLLAVMQSQLNNDGTVYFRYPKAGSHTFTFSPTQFSYGLLTHATSVQFFELRGEHPLFPGLLQLLPEKIGEIVYDPVHPDLQFREDITASLNFQDIRKNDNEYRVGVWHKCPKEIGGTSPGRLMDDERDWLEGATHSVVDHDAMSVGVFTKEGVMNLFGWQADTWRQSHDIVTVDARFLPQLPNGTPDTTVQRVKKHGLFVHGASRKRSYAPLPEELFAFRSERIPERNFALGAIGLRQQLARGRMTPSDPRIIKLIDQLGRDIITPQSYLMR